MARPANPLNKSVTLAAAFKAIPKKSRIALVKALHVSGVRGINVEFGTVKRGPGRPKGSKNKVKSVDVTPTVKRGPGRPRKTPVEAAPAAPATEPAAPTA